MTSITKELDRLAPPLFRDGATTEQYLAAIETTIPTVASFARLAHAIAAMNDHDAARTIYRALIPILEHYENPRGWSGTYKEADFDYWRFLGHELVVTLIAALLNEERYDIINDLLNEPLIVTNAHLGDGKPVDYAYASEWLRSFEALDKTAPQNLLPRPPPTRAPRRTTRRRTPLPAIPRRRLPPLRPRRSSTRRMEDRGVAWVPWSSVYLRETPHFIHSAARTAIAQKLASTLGAPDVPTPKVRLMERAGKLARIWSFGGRQPLTTEQVGRIGT